MIMRFNWCVLDVKEMTLRLLSVLMNIWIENSCDVSLCWQLSGGCELTVVLHDFSAGCSTELSVSTGEGGKKKNPTLIAFIILISWRCL